MGGHLPVSSAGKVENPAGRDRPNTPEQLMQIRRRDSYPLGKSGLTTMG